MDPQPPNIFFRLSIVYVPFMFDGVLFNAMLTLRQKL